MGLIIIFGMFLFPLPSMRLYNLLSEPKITMFLASYGICAILFHHTEYHIKGINVFLRTIVCTAAGLIGRFLLEYGEVSNTHNFTITNILLYLLITPMFVCSVYYLLPQNSGSAR